MVSIRETIIVEGKYDKNKLKQIVDAQVIETSGFGIFKDGEKRELLRKLGEKHGLIVLTDSDSAGFVIRNHLRGILPKEYVKHAYIPRIEGKERRKAQKSKEGILGVEGVDSSVIIEALYKAGATVVTDGETKKESKEKITKTNMYEDGLSGGKESSQLRNILAERLGFPKGMSSNALLEAMNLLIDYKEYKSIVCRITSKQ